MLTRLRLVLVIMIALLGGGCEFGCNFFSSSADARAKLSEKILPLTQGLQNWEGSSSTYPQIVDEKKPIYQITLQPQGEMRFSSLCDQELHGPATEELRSTLKKLLDAVPGNKLIIVKALTYPEESQCGPRTLRPSKNISVLKQQDSESLNPSFYISPPEVRTLGVMKPENLGNLRSNWVVENVIEPLIKDTPAYRVRIAEGYNFKTEKGKTSKVQVSVSYYD